MLQESVTVGGPLFHLQLPAAGSRMSAKSTVVVFNACCQIPMLHCSYFLARDFVCGLLLICIVCCRYTSDICVYIYLLYLAKIMLGILVMGFEALIFTILGKLMVRQGQWHFSLRRAFIYFIVIYQQNVVYFFKCNETAICVSSYLLMIFPYFFLSSFSLRSNSN